MKGTRELICSSSGPSRALNLIFESSSVTKEGSRVTPSQNRPSDKLSCGRPISTGQTQMPCVDEAAPGASQSACPGLMLSWATVNAGRLPSLLGEVGGKNGGACSTSGTGCGGNVPTGQARPQEAHRSELSSQGSDSTRRLAEPTCDTQKPPLIP